MTMALLSALVLDLGFDAATLAWNVVVLTAVLPSLDDSSFTVRPENARAHRNTDDFYLLAR
jgi:hypothetical protein